MTAQVKVTINQWLLTSVCGIACIFSTFQLFQYRVVQAEQCIEEVDSKIDEAGKERAEMQRITAEIAHSVGSLATAVGHSTLENSEQHLSIQASISELGDKIKDR